jgi:uncharacterized phiE125 gp8 family phage protein
MTFTQPYFWQVPRGRALPRWRAVPVTPAVSIVSSSVAAASVITTAVPHGLATGDTVAIAGHTGSTPAIDGSRVVTVLSSLTFSIPLQVTVAGTGGTATRTAAAPVITLADAKLHVRALETTAEDVPFANWIKGATQQVENDTGRALPPQTFDLAGDAFPSGGAPITLPFGPLVDVVSIKSYTSAGVLATLTATDYLADVSSVPGRIGLADTAIWPTDLRLFQPILVRVVVGSAVVAIPEPLLQAVRLAVGWHSANRQPTVLEKQSYDWLLDPYRTVVLA